jgi:3-hydroxyisobutyrate dehydrogenase-like beta-hydroxyacid dehydrogenase
MSEERSQFVVGYIGLGIMGAAMANNLLQAGHRTIVWNRTAAKCEPLQSAGAEVADSPADMAAKCPGVIFINVTNTSDVEEVLFGANGVASQAARGLIVVDNSTISPTATQQFAARLKEQEVLLLDAPVSGGDVGAKNGTLSIMCGGDQVTFERVLPLLQVLGKQAALLGPSGAGQACKACNQIAVSGTLLAVCEALALAKQNGLDLKQMVQVVSAGAGGSWQLQNLGPKIADGDHAPGFMVDLLLKDLAIVLDTAREQKLPLALTALAENYFRAVSASGGGALGTQAVAQTVEKLGHFSYAESTPADVTSDEGERN